MDPLYYVFFTILIIIISLIAFIVLLTTHILKKKPFNFISYIILFLSLIGMYLFIPAEYVYIGYSTQNPEKLNTAINLSINPHEKRLAYLFMSDIYKDKKDGNKAIEFLEKSLNKQYLKYPLEADSLLYLYSIKGDYQKTLELSKILNKKQGIALRNIYIMNNEYEKALTTFENGNKSNTYLFLKADLQMKLGQIEEANQTQNEAEKFYNAQLENYTDSSKRNKYIEYTKKYSSIAEYKSYLEKQAKEYNFN